ncbi:MAG: cyclic nucleotide-binding domain-containing protein [Planctomycetes bacterium]|nr:cyclic nucleotide-binding domain-containing protein [Planctomycetota bacterium]
MTDDESPTPAPGDIHELRRPASEAIPNLRRLMSKTRRIGIWADRIRHAYFSDPAKRRVVRKGERILTQDVMNDKLFYVEEGSFTCSVLVESSNGERERLELFRVKPGGFVGVRSFFSDAGLAVFDSTADEDSVVCWMDQGTEPVDVGHYGSLREQFFPVIMKELEHRQFRLTWAAKERVSARIRLHKAEDMATLGQFAAGLAHELNNATSVLMSSSQHLGGQLGQYFDRYAPELSAWFRPRHGAGRQPLEFRSQGEGAGIIPHPAGRLRDRQGSYPHVRRRHSREIAPGREGTADRLDDRPQLPGHPVRIETCGEYHPFN